MPPNEPKTPVTRTLPAVDVVFENDELPPTQRNVALSSSELAALRRIMREAPSTPVPESRPSLPVRAAKRTARGAFIGSAVVGVITLAGALDPDVVRGLIALAHILGEMAHALRAGFGAQ